MFRRREPEARYDLKIVDSMVVCSFSHRINTAFGEKVGNLIVREAERKKMYRIHKV